MAQRNDEHLTTAQLSAYLDKELSPDEKAFSDAHLATCQACQGRLADLRLTVSLLRALPSEAAPRSFALPTTLATLPPQTLRAVPSARSPRAPTRAQRVFRGTFRTVSTLAAVVGLLLLLGGFLSTFSFTQGGASMGAASNSANSGTHTTAGEAPNVSTPTPVKGTSHTTPQVGRPSPTPPPVVKPAETPTTPAPSFTLPPALDPGNPLGQFCIGAILLLLGIIGVILTRQR